MAIASKPSRASVEAPLRRRSCRRQGTSGADFVAAAAAGRGLGTHLNDRRPTYLFSRGLGCASEVTATLGLVRAGPYSLNGGRFLFCTLPVSYCVSSPCAPANDFNRL
jgi:hypothetical protein